MASLRKALALGLLGGIQKGSETYSDLLTKKMEGGDKPSSAKEWEYMQNLMSPEEQQGYTEFRRPNPYGYESIAGGFRPNPTPRVGNKETESERLTRLKTKQTLGQPLSKEEQAFIDVKEME